MHVSVYGYGQLVVPEIVQISVEPVEAAISRAIQAPLMARTVAVSAAAAVVAGLVTHGAYEYFCSIEPVAYGDACKQAAVDEHHALYMREVEARGCAKIIRETALEEIAFRQLLVELDINLRAAVPIEIIIIEI